MIVSLLLSFACIAASGQIAFVSGINQESQTVCVLDLSTNTVVRVGPGRADGAPVWSPDGQWLAFDSRRDDGVGIVMVRHDGSDVHLVSHGDSLNVSPRWSPDGAHLAYTAGSGVERHVVVYDIARGTETRWGGSRVGLMRPVWRKADSLLALGLVQETDRPGIDVYSVTLDAAVPYQQTPKYAEWCVETDARGNVIAFESNDGGDREIFVISKKLTPVNISNHRAADWNPVWSPDGKWLAFESFRKGRRGVFRCYTSTLRIYPVAASEDHDNWAPAWSPDGKCIAFVSDRTGKPELFVAELKSDAVRQVTEGQADALAPAWRPETE